MLGKGQITQGLLDLKKVFNFILSAVRNHYRSSIRKVTGSINILIKSFPAECELS
jgi:hypothetical protein